jgi:hypothetical protein
LLRIVVGFYRRLEKPMVERLNQEELQLKNQSRIVSLPCREETIRGYSRVTLLIIDEAARVPDLLYRAVRPMLAVSQGQLICLSTPFGRRGFFYEAWSHGGADWKRIEVPAQQIPRIPLAYLEEERRCLGESWFRQEYCCSFEAVEGLVYPDFARCVVPGPAPDSVSRYGGIDFGFRNPFAAVWGVLDRDEVLWLTSEHYARARPLHYHAHYLPREVFWFADPSGAQERCELIRAGLRIRAGNNKIRLGIMAVTARLETGTLRIVEGCCPNLLHEASLYRYNDNPVERGGEVPVDEHNHALAALRYLVASLDQSRLVRLPSIPLAPAEGRTGEAEDPWSFWDDGEHWSSIR